MYYGGKTYLAYSASDCWTAGYQLGLLTWNGGDPTQASSWAKTGPFLTSTNGNYGAGHNGSSKAQMGQRSGTYTMPMPTVLELVIEQDIQ
ncbi:hypothetical protein VC83_01640 [Pseudogymnoascus destructans]|uniref:Uncharacterized protein n=1 Tax=Pseudogymnoascus destructans TaxID=655981 RepID=A0A177AKQ6_9PEZI|nr:uncharacterized protein VC83_01640 [Pseudogymnoascus destructans]OAF61871.1 hypothetical protein VC83_01640 [Pseudogymnoascus destructans]